MAGTRDPVEPGTAEAGEPAAPHRRGLWKPLVLIGVIVALFLLANALGLGKRLDQLRDWIDSLGAWAPAAYIAVYVAATIAMVPGSALTLAAGALFGSFLGVVCVSIAATIGAALCFLIARYFARDSIARWLRGNERFRRLDALTERQGWIIVAITRLVPLFPFNLLNYGFGLTRVRFVTYVFFSWLCMIPGTILYVVGSDTVSTGISEGRVPWPLVGVLAAAIALLALLVRGARRRLRKSEEAAAVAAGPGAEAKADE
jgi:uncharacterized membrane protein YdjX (TVP38/TMEM64 family)